MKIYSRAGDKGKTSFGGKRLEKDSLCCEFIGELDELNSILGLVASFLKERQKKELIERIQKDLFLIGASLAGKGGGGEYLKKEVKEFEKEIDRLEEKLPPLGNFILPGGKQTASLFHLSRSICRRGERRVVELAKKQKIEGEILAFLNRLSDLLFVLAREENAKAGIKEKIWKI